jgi:Tfp pilus assembly protein PilX
MPTLSRFFSASSRNRTRTRLLTALRSRAGFALFMALGALVIIAVLIAGSTYVTLQESQLGENQLVQSRAFTMAEYGLNKIQADWDKTPNLTMANGAKFDTSYTLAGQGTCNVRYVRLNDETFWIVSEGRANVGNSVAAARTAVKRVGAILRLRIPTVNTNGAVEVNGNITVKGSAGISGTNSNPWSDGSCTGISGSDLAGVSYPADDTYNEIGNPAVAGNPASQPLDAAGVASTYVTYGDETWNSLKTQANFTLPGGDYNANVTPVAVAGSCDKSVSTNWGEPHRSGADYVAECINYFPIVYFSGSTKFNGNGRGQGILLIEGDLTLNGGFEWDGLIIARDNVKNSGGTAKIYGSIMAGGANLDNTVTEDNLSGNITINYSACALTRALRGSAQVTQAKDRAWAELS